MSTRCSISYVGQLHLYQECGEDTIHFELMRRWNHDNNDTVTIEDLKKIRDDIDAYLKRSEKPGGAWGWDE